MIRAWSGRRSLLRARKVWDEDFDKVRDKVWREVDDKDFDKDYDKVFGEV
jgi:hypothetical protein